MRRLPQHLAFSAVLLTISFFSTTELSAQAAGNSIVNQSFTATLQMQQNVPQSTHTMHPPNIVSSPVFMMTDSTILLDVSVMMNVLADRYVAIFALEQVGPTADSTTRMADKRIKDFIGEIKALGIKEKDIYLDVVSNVPLYSYQVEQKLYSHTFNEIPIGFTQRKNIHIGYTDSEVLEKLVAAAARQEIYDIVKVDYIVDNIEKVYDSLRHSAIRLVQRKVKDFSVLGVKIASDSPMLTEGSGATMPIERYGSFSAFGSTSIRGSEAGRENLYGYAEINPADKPRTIYYNPLPLSAYDIVENPNVVEPVVQFTYRLTVQYKLRDA